MGLCRLIVSLRQPAPSSRFGPMPNIFDNLSDDTRLGPAVRQTLDDFDTLDVATGYLDLRGWSEFADLIDSKPPVTDDSPRPTARLLVGMVAPSDSGQILQTLQNDVQPKAYGADIHDREKALARRDQLVAHLRNQLMRGLATKSGQKTLRSLKRQLNDGVVEMKVFTERPLHGKTYIFYAPAKKHSSRWAYVGSSNLTGAGLNTNLELNIDIQDSDATEKVARWFEARWSDNFSLTITAEIIELIAASWADEQQPTPFELYLKVCHSLSQDARDGLGYVLPASMHNLLLDYQESAVRTLARRVVRRGGTMLGDVVGLGKTLTAVATALMLEAAEDYSTLVCCPKNLECMWTEHMEAYGVNGRVVPYSMVHTVLPELRRFNLVICDESHNLRNSGTIVHEALRDYVGRNGSKVLLLTATPYNLAFQDVGNQIGLYLDADADLGIVPAAALAADPTLVDKVDGKINTLAAFMRSEEANDWRRLMSDHLIRRTRTFIKRSAKTELVEQPDGTTVERKYLEFSNGDRFRFPDRVARPLNHNFTEGDPAMLMEDDETLDALQSLRLPRYRLADYDDPTAEHSRSDIEHLDDIRAGRGNVSGFVRVGLFKRLSSSGHAFIRSLRRQRDRNDLFLYAIDARLPVPLGSFTDRQFAVSDEDLDEDEGFSGSLSERYDQLRGSLPVKTKWINTTILRRSFRVDLASDNEILDNLLRRFGAWDWQRDSKVAALVELLTGEHAGEKILVFTEYADTAEYVAEALHAAGLDRVGVVTGSTHDPSAVARRFAPNANRLPGQPASPEADEARRIDVLVATDVLSEGQNLHDSHIIVNYDLPWAIIRIIQRAGRVDRIGQDSDTVYVYLITHEKIEQQLRLRQRIKARLGAAAEAFGSDEEFFGGSDEIQILEDFYDGRVADSAEESDGEADAVSEAWLTWSNAQKKHPQIARRVLALQDLVHSSREQYVNEISGHVTCFVAHCLRRGCVRYVHPGKQRWEPRGTHHPARGDETVSGRS